MIFQTTNPTPEAVRLREVIKELGLPLRRLQEILSWSPQNCLAWWAQGKDEHKINFQHITRLAQTLSLNADDLYSGFYDRRLARQRMLGDYQSLPSRYIDRPNSYLRTSEHIFKYVVLTRGQLFADRLMATLNVSPLIYDDTNKVINLVYFADLLEALAKSGFSQHELDTLASVIFLSLQNTPLGQRFEESENFFDVYSTLAKNFAYFDSNFEYSSEFVGKKFILNTVLPLENHGGLKNQPAKLQALVRYRHILLAWFPYLAGMTPLFPKAETQYFSDSIHTRYELQLDKSTRPPVRLVEI